MIARGDALKDVAARVGCSRSTLWRVLQRSERLRTRIAEEQRFLAVEVAGRFRGLHGAAVDAIEAAVREGNLRAAFWVADRLGLARIGLGEARAGLDLAEEAAAWGEAPPPDPAVYALDAPLALEAEALQPDVPAHDAARTETPHPDAEPARAEAPPAASARPFQPLRRATFPESCFTTFHKVRQKQGRKAPPIPDLLNTAAVWPQMPPGVVRPVLPAGGAVRMAG